MEDTDIDARARVLVKDLAAWALGLSSRTSRISDLLAASQAVEVLLRNGYSLACLGEDDIAKIDSTIEKYVTESEAFFDFESASTNKELIRCFRRCKTDVYRNNTRQLLALQTQVIGKVDHQKASFISSCTTLKTLLRYSLISDDISKTVSLLCDPYWTINGSVDKELFSYYSMMTFVEAFLERYCLEETEGNSSTKPPIEEVVQERVPIIINQILAKILSMQKNDGSWRPRENSDATAQALLTLLAIISLPYSCVLEMEIRHAIARGRQALSLMAYPQDRHNASSTSTSSDTFEPLSQSYFLAASKRPIVAFLGHEQNRAQVESQVQIIQAYSKFFSGLDHLANVPLYLIKASIIEGLRYQPILKTIRADIFPRTKAKEKDKYLHYIPIMWTLPSTCSKLFLPPEYLLDMMVLSMFIFLTDEYMESTVTHFSEAEFKAFRKILEDRTFPQSLSASQSASPESPLGPDPNGHAADLPSPRAMTARLRSAISVFQAFTTAVLSYPHISSASPSDLLCLRSETALYLLHHLTQLEDNARFAQQAHLPARNTRFATPRTSYATWVNTVGAGHVSGPFAFAFFTCYLSGAVRHGADCFTGVAQKMRAYTMNTHIGAFCRMYNDYGSIERDREERNLNSVNFPEFFDARAEGGVGGEEAAAKATLLNAAAEERDRALEHAAALYRDLEAEGEDGRRIADCLRVYIGACEQFSDMYLTRDVTNRVR